METKNYQTYTGILFIWEQEK